VVEELKVGSLDDEEPRVGLLDSEEPRVGLLDSEEPRAVSLDDPPVPVDHPSEGQLCPSATLARLSPMPRCLEYQL
jgi:hypothetical protein